MSIKINYSNKAISKSSANLVLFADEKFSSNSLKKYLSNLEFSYISDLLKTSDLKKNMFVFDMFFNSVFTRLTLHPHNMCLLPMMNAYGDNKHKMIK